MSEQLKFDRRRFLSAAAITITAGPLVMIDSADAQTVQVRPENTAVIKAGANSSFDSIKQINAGVLNVGYAEAGPADGPVVILLHGWPYDIHSYVDVAPMLAAKG